MVIKNIHNKNNRFQCKRDKESQTIHVYTISVILTSWCSPNKIGQITSRMIGFQIKKYLNCFVLYWECKWDKQIYVNRYKYNIFWYTAFWFWHLQVSTIACIYTMSRVRLYWQSLLWYEYIYDYVRIRFLTTSTIDGKI